MTQNDSIRKETDYPLLHNPGWMEVMMRHYELDASEFALRFAGTEDWPVREIAEQRHCYPRAQEKLGPLHRPGMIYLREALEQASGYATATWRARNWVTTGEKSKRSAVSKDDSSSGARLHDNPDSPSEPDSIFRVADLTGGLGIDSAAFALAGAHVDYCERQPLLAAIARHNHGLQELTSRIRWHTGDGLAWLAGQRTSGQSREQEQRQKRDLVYIDPSRRTGGKRVLSLQESEPDVTRHMALIRSAAHRCLVKLSPMMDPVDAARSLDDCVAVIAVSVDGELKELLADCVPAQKQEVPDQRRPPLHVAVMLDASGKERFRFTSESGASGTAKTYPEQPSHTDPQTSHQYSHPPHLQSHPHPSPSTSAPPPSAQPPATLLFEPDPSLFKMRLIDEVARRYGLVRIHPGIGYLTDGQLPTPSGPPSPSGPPTPSTPEAFPGKVFRIRRTLPFKPRHLKKWLGEAGLTRVHIHQRGFPLTVDQLYKKLGCRMGEDAHLFATTAHDGQKVVIVTDRIG